MASSLQAAATFMQPTKVPLNSRNLKSTQCISKAFGLEPSAPKLTCSLHSDLKDLAQKCLDATKLAGFALATSALLVSVCFSCFPFLPYHLQLLHFYSNKSNQIIQVVKEV